MKAVMVMYDSLRLDMLPCYGGKEISLPNFDRLAKHTVTFDNSYVCSLPCMPSRRELHTGRANFMHRSWGPLEPFDDSMPELLRQNNIYTYLVTDHNHYVEDGGATYCPRYSAWECNRGQEGDPWQASAEKIGESTHVLPMPPQTPEGYRNIADRMHYQDVLNRRAFKCTADYPQAKTFESGVCFLQQNAQYDNWFVQIETFDPHEPFDAPKQFISRIFDPDRLSDLDWPPYAPVQENDDEIYNFRTKYMALLSFCDECLGKVLDEFDRLDLWRDTMLIVNTDHGYMLGEHGWWSKGIMPEYQETAHTPMFMWDPRSGAKNMHRQSLVQTIDIAPTLLEYFNVPIPKDMLGKPLGGVAAEDKPVREHAVFGYHAGIMNVTDGRYKLMVAVKENAPAMFDYTLMPTHMRARFSCAELQRAEFVQPFSFTKGCKVLRVPTAPKVMSPDLPLGKELLFDLQNDPAELTPIQDAAVTTRLKAAMKKLMQENDAPNELYACYGI